MFMTHGDKCSLYLCIHISMYIPTHREWKFNTCYSIMDQSFLHTTQKLISSITHLSIFWQMVITIIPYLRFNKSIGLKAATIIPSDGYHCTDREILLHYPRQRRGCHFVFYGKICMYEN